MARTKRKVNAVTPEVAPAKEVKAACRAAGYVRLSIEDGNRPGSETMASQERLVREYIENHPDLILAGIWCDNGKTGTNFERPQFEALMDAIKRREIDCVVVKDLSRFGRNYKETGNYLERIFPFLGVRFIAVNDNFDTQTAERNEYGFIVPLKNLMNETYSRDISRKVSTALEAKERRGEFIGVWAPYGYSKSPENRHQLVVNPETAPVIREIFALRLTGAGYCAIMHSLNDREIPSPSAYLYQKGLSHNEKYRNTLWTMWNIKEILRNETYIGNLVQGKRTQQTYKQAWDTRYAPAETWRITKGTHEAIVDEQTFQAVQAISTKRKAAYDAALGQADDLKTPNLFRGLIFCADCGRAMTRSQIYSNRGGKRFYYYTYKCPTAVNKTTACTAKNLWEKDLMEVISDTLHSHLEAITELETRIASISENRANAQENAVAAQMAAAEKELGRYGALRDGLYQNLVDGIVDRQEYLMMKEKYQQRCDEIEVRIQSLQLQLENTKRFSLANTMFAELSKFKSASCLSEEMTHALISRIEVCKDKSLNIALAYRDEFAALSNYVMEESE